MGGRRGGKPKGVASSNKSMQNAKKNSSHCKRRVLFLFCKTARGARGAEKRREHEREMEKGAESERLCERNYTIF